MKFLSLITFLLVLAVPASAQTVQQSLLTTQVPQTSQNTLAWELGVSLSFDASGSIPALRFYKTTTDTGSHTGRVWSSNGALLATVFFLNETASGWQQQVLTTPIRVAAGTALTVSVSSSSGANYALLPNGFPLSNGHISALVGVYGAIGLRPLATTTTDYFRDVVFVPDAPIGAVTLVSDSVNGYTATLNGFDPGLYTLVVSIQNAAGITIASSLQIIMPPKAPQ